MKLSFRKRCGNLLCLVLSAGVLTGAIPYRCADAHNPANEKRDVESLSFAAEKTVSFNDGWSFGLEPSGKPETVDYDDSGWEYVTLPHDWSIYRDFEGSIGSGVGSLRGGNGWYRKSFTLPQNLSGKRISIDFDGVYQDSYIYVNGQLVGNYPNGYVPFSFDITDYVTCDGKTENVIAVSVSNVTDDKKSGYTSRWYSGSGIYRDVYMTVTEPVHVEKYGVVVTTPDLEYEYPSGKATVDISTNVVNESSGAAWVSVRNTVMNYYGVKAYAGAEPVVSEACSVEAGGVLNVSQRMTVDNPELWSVDNPKLYNMKTEVLLDGKVVDTYETRFGFKYFNFDADTGFSLNGEWMKLHGVCLHHDQGALGAEGNEAAFRRQIKIMKEMGVNAIRTSHNAASPKFIKLCDEMGIMVFEESFDTWWKGKNDYDYGKQFFMLECTYPGVEDGTTWGKYDLQQIIKKDRNSPSIIMWSIGNECNETTEREAISYVSEIMSWVKEVDSVHPASMGENKYKLDWSNPTIMKQVNDELDLVGLNYGEAYYDSLHADRPDWKIFGSETTSTVSSRGYYASPWISGDHAVDNVDGNLADDAVSGRQLSEYDNRTARFGRNVTEALIFDRDRQFIAGQFVWTGFDYIGEPTPFYGTAKSSYFGIVDTCGFAKDRYYLYQSQWTDVKDNPMVHIMPHWNWENDAMRKKVTYPEKSALDYLDDKEKVNYSDESIGKIPVRIYSNAPCVELFVDGVSQGKKEFAQKQTNYGMKYQQQSEDSDRLYLEWALPWEYKVGTAIEAIAYDESGKEIARDKVVTAGEAAQLNASADRTVIVSDGRDLSYITVDVTDEYGNFMPTASNKIEFSISGDGEIVGVDNGDPTSRERYKDKNGEWSRSAFNGKALVIVRSTKNAGNFTVTASSGSLEACSVTVNTVPRAENLSEDENSGEDKDTNVNVPGVSGGSQTGSSDTDKEVKLSESVKTFKKGAFKYKITSADKKTVSTVSFTGKKSKKAVIPAAVKYKGVSYKVTSIGKKTFSGGKNLKSVTIGKNVVEIKKSAFYNCKNIKTIDIKSAKLKKAAKKAFVKTGINKVKVTAPKKKLAGYIKMLKKAGLENC
ncbi:MAG: DUF4982 domain-containing protein [Lachnospiraceae bacterium]|nr:DUF4982 domain-containing protein [Lachnospiraceae bacterium]